MCGLVAPIALSDLLLCVSPSVSATPKSGDSCLAEVPRVLADDCYHSSGEHCGDHVEFNDDDPLSILLRPTRITPAGKHVEELVEGLAWRDCGGYVFQKVEHINVQELEAVKLQAKYLVSLRGALDARRPFSIDSRVVASA